MTMRRWGRGGLKAIAASMMVGLLAASAGAEDAASRFIWEGQLRGADGRPLDGRQRIGFAIFRGGSADGADSGALLYGETVEADVSRGRTAHAVGTGTATVGSLDTEALSSAGKTEDTEQTLWLQISVGDEQRVVLPRTRLEAAPYAAAAGDARRLGGLPAEAYVTAAALAKSVKAAALGAGQIVKASGTGYLSFIGGGQNHDASGGMSSIAGGTDNHATWWAAFVGGGSFNWATGAYSAVAGGLGNSALNDQSFVGGGSNNKASGIGSVVGGGSYNTASGANSMVLGGQGNTVSAPFSFAAGRRAKAAAQGAFVWADSQDADLMNNTADSFQVRAKNGALFGSDSSHAAMTIYNGGTGAGLTVAKGLAGGTAMHVLNQKGDGIFVDSLDGNGIRVEVAKGITAEAVFAQSYSADGAGIVGEANSGANSVGVLGRSTSGFAGRFVGKVAVSSHLSVGGTLTKSAGSFKIDHPLDPNNKYLSHSFVESPDMMNVYNGNCALDAQGAATVKLPAYFEALNRDFRYQLTTIGAPALVYVASEVQNNSFSIAGGQPGMKVSWQVTGIRKDAYAQAHPIVVEEPKP